MSENKDLIPSAGPSVIRVKHLKVISPEYDMAQFGRTIKAFAGAGMPFEMIVNTGQSLGYPVEKGEIDALLKEPDIFLYEFIISLATTSETFPLWTIFWISAEARANSVGFSTSISPKIL